MQQEEQELAQVLDFFLLLRLVVYGKGESRKRKKGEGRRREKGKGKGW